MTVNSATASQSYTGNSITQIFPVPFYFLVDTDLKITKKSGATGLVSTLTLNSDYTLTGAGNTDGGSVTLTVAPAGNDPTTGNPDQLYIERNVVAVQQTAYPENSKFPSASHERALDRLTMLVQQIIAKLTFGMFRDPLGNTYDVGGGRVVNASDAADATGLTTLQQVLNLLNGVIGGAASYIASGLGSITRMVQDKLRERPSVVDYGADPTGVLSSAAAFNAALAANDDVFIPAGTYLLNDAVTVGLGKKLHGAGRRKTILRMPSTFNMAATGCLVFTGGEPGPEVTDLTIIQDQPDSTIATAYPPCIYTQNVARFVLRRLRLACVYVGIDMKGNCGGALLDDIELSPLSVGIDIDGSIDSVKISRLHLWVFAGAGFGGLTTNQRVSYTAAYGIKSGRCDDLHLSDSLLLSMIKALYLYNSASGYTFGQVTNVDFDSRGGLWVVTDGRIQLSACTMTMGATDSWFIHMTGGAVAVDSTRFVANTFNASANGLIEQAGGNLTLGPGCSVAGSGNDTQLIYSANATLKLNGINISRATNTAYAAAAVRVVNSSGVAVGCMCAGLGTGSSVFIKIDTDAGGFVAKDNYAKGWTISTPVASALANTIVDGNLGAGTNKDTFTGYFSSDGTTTIKAPSGWTVSRLSTGTYTVTHNLSLAANTDMGYRLTTDTTASGAIASVDMAGTNTNLLKIRTYVGTTLTDCGVFFDLKRFRS